MPLPNILEFIGTNVTQAGFKVAQQKLLDYLGIEVSTKTELSSAISTVNGAIAVKVDKVYLDTALSSFQNGAIKTYPTLSAANADIANIALNTKVSVLDATDGGDYYKATESSTSLTKSGHDAVEQSKKYTDQEVSQLKPVSLSPESGYVYGWTDPVSGRTPIRIRVDGGMEIDNFYLSDNTITLSNLKSDITTLLPSLLDSESGYVYGWTDPVSGRTPIRIAVDGTFYADNLVLGEGTIKAENLATDVKRQVLAHQTDKIKAYIDPFRAIKTNVGLKTQGAGYWNVLPPFKTKSIFGVNKSGQSIQIRKTANLPILGVMYQGDWSFDNSVESKYYKGRVTGGGTPTGSHNAGDYYLYANGGNTTSTAPNAGMNVGDVLVYDGSAWKIQKAPSSYANRTNRHFWRATVSGWFDGVKYAVGDLILYITRQTGGGGDQFERWKKIDVEKGDLAFCGTITELPALPVKGGVYTVSISASFDGISFSALDYAVYEGTAWLKVSNNTITTIESNASFYLTCDDASDYELKRTDSSAQSVGFSADCYTQSNTVRSSDELVLISDSMFGAGAGTAVLTESKRSGEVLSYGGSTSNQILDMFNYLITQGDVHQGKTVLFWHGQNNQPSNLTNEMLIKECSLRMYQAVGAENPRVAFLSVLGQRNAVWDETLNRFVISQHEDQKAKTGHLWSLRQWYDKTFPNRHIDTYKLLLAEADNTPDVTFPGMTEKQVAEDYGVAPYSFFRGPFPGELTAADMNYVGTWSSISLPTITANSGDYYLQIANASSSSQYLVVYVAGAWIKHAVDFTHLGTRGNEALAKAVSKYLNENNL